MKVIDAENVAKNLTAMKERLGVDAISIDALVDGLLNREPTIDAVPTSELYELKNEMYENDGITMSNVAKLNALISKYANGEPVHGIRHGHWTDDDNCSMCWFHITQKTRHYCPSCGAKMDEVSE